MNTALKQAKQAQQQQQSPKTQQRPQQPEGGAIVKSNGFIKAAELKAQADADDIALTLKAQYDSAFKTRLTEQLADIFKDEMSADTVADFFGLDPALLLPEPEPETQTDAPEPPAAEQTIDTLAVASS